MWGNDFYKILSITDNNDHQLFKIELNPSHHIFEGHFPGQPILPGVCTLQIIRECVVDILKKDIRIDYISSCKYLAAVNPIDNNIIDIKISTKPIDIETISLTSEGVVGGDIFIKLKANLRIA